MLLISMTQEKILISNTVKEQKVVEFKDNVVVVACTVFYCAAYHIKEQTYSAFSRFAVNHFDFLKHLFQFCLL